MTRRVRGLSESERADRADSIHHFEVGGPVTRCVAWVLQAQPQAQTEGVRDEADVRASRADPEPIQAEAIPDDHPVVPQLLGNLFGDAVPSSSMGAASISWSPRTQWAGAQSAKVVNLANWSDDNPTQLRPHGPGKPTDVVVVLGSSIEWRLGRGAGRSTCSS